MNTFEVRKEIKNDLRKVLILCKIPYKFQDNILESPITQEMFEDYVSRAECEYASLSIKKHDLYACYGCCYTCSVLLYDGRTISKGER